MSPALLIPVILATTAVVGSVAALVIGTLRAYLQERAEVAADELGAQMARARANAGADWKARALDAEKRLGYYRDSMSMFDQIVIERTTA